MPFELNIVTPQGDAYSGTVDSVVLPGTEGDFGVLQSHERFLTPLRIGPMEIHEPGQVIFAAIGDGFAEVQGDHVSVLVDSCELAGDIDVARAELARDRAEQHLAELGADPEAQRYDEFGKSLERARNRLEISKRV